MDDLGLGSKGLAVTAWQAIVGTKPDGDFGPATQMATRIWQSQHGLTATGAVGLEEWDTAAKIPPEQSDPVQGLDVSAIQGNVPWKALALAGHRFAFLRCQVGNETTRDVKFVDNVRAAKDNGFFLAPYDFPFPLPHLDPVAQADLFAKSADIDGHPLGAEKGELPPAYDLEWPPPELWAKWKCSANQIIDWSLKCLERMEQNWGCKPIIYSYPYFLQSISKGDGFLSFMQYKLWIAGGAQYENGDGHLPDLTKEGPPKVPGWGSDWLFNQWDGNGGKRLPNGVDADFNVYRYDLASLERLCQSLADDDRAIETPRDLSTIFAKTSELIVEDSVHAYRQERAQRIIDEAGVMA